MKNWDIGDWFIFACITVTALVVLGVAFMGTYSYLDNDREQNACRHSGGTIEYIQAPHTQEWNCKTPAEHR